MDIIRYKYYDSPEGKDCLKKLFAVSKIAAGIGFGFSSAVVILTEQKGYLSILGNYARFTLPSIGMAAAFASTTCMLTQLRKKDTRLNYFLGGMAAGAVAGAATKSAMTGFNTGIVLGLAAILKHITVEEGWKIELSVPARGYGNLRNSVHDYTWMPDPPRGWKVSEDE